MRRLILILLLVFIGESELFAQNIPLNLPILNEYLRREQVIGRIGTDFSFNYKPILVEKAFPQFKSPFLNEVWKDSTMGSEAKEPRIKVSPMPLQLITTYNSNHPYGWGNGALIPTKGIQTLISAGAHLKFGKLSIQLYPQYQFAQNLPFEEYPEEANRRYYSFLFRGVNGIDSPVRPGNEQISKLFLGNSHINLNLGGITMGVSNENIWIGPGQLNSLVLTDNAPGFLHFKVNSNKQLNTFIGGFEGMYWVGGLSGSELPYFSDGAGSEVFIPKDDSSWRYFTGISLSYSPKWTPGLSVGLTRVFQIYRDDMGDDLRSYFPLFAPFPKIAEGLQENNDKREDQNVSVFGRYVIPKANTEFYFEFSRNDHPFNWRDLILNPEHSRGFLLGFSKYFNKTTDKVWGIIGEITHTQFSMNNIIRWGQGQPNRGLGLYDNYQVRHGLTNIGQNLGASTGPSGNTYNLKVGKFSGLKEISVQVERWDRHPNFFKYADSGGLDVSPWVDHSIYGNYNNHFKNLLIKSSIGLIHSLNYNYGYLNSGNSVFNTNSNHKISFNLNASVTYVF